MRISTIAFAVLLAGLVAPAVTLAVCGGIYIADWADGEIYKIVPGD